MDKETAEKCNGEHLRRVTTFFKSKLQSKFPLTECFQSVDMGKGNHVDSKKKLTKHNLE